MYFRRVVVSSPRRRPAAGAVDSEGSVTASGAR